MPLILTYKEKRLGTSYIYKLFDDHILIRNKTFLSYNAGVILPLEILKPQPTKICRRDPSFKWGLGMSILMTLGCIYTGATEGWTSGDFYTYIPCAVIAIALTAILSQRFDFIEFQDDTGLVHLAMTKGEKAPQALDEFVNTITQYIRLARHIE